VTEGLSNKEIGNNLGITERTVKFHVGNVLAKLGVQDRHSAAKMARSLLVSESGDCPRRYLPVPSS
jgi:DNA-binding NarL/FixJ family response regulator